MSSGRLAAAAFFLASIVGSAAATSQHLEDPPGATLSFRSDDPHQILFLIGIGELEKGNHASAVKILQSLYQTVKTRRIQLELARALFLDRQFKRSRQFFREVYEDPSTPLNVRENIKLYLDEIDAALGQVKLAFEIVTDSNPLRFTEAKKIIVAGQPLIVTEPKANKTVVGAKYGIDATKSLNEDASFVVFLDAAFQDFQGSRYDRFKANGGLLFAPKQHPKYRARIGIEEAFYDRSHLYEYPYVVLTFIPDPVEQFRLRTEIEYGILDVADSDHLDAKNLTISVNGTRRFPGQTWLISNFYVENADTDENAYSYGGAGIGAELSFPFWNKWDLKLTGALGLRRYRDADPIFGSTRKDDTYTAGVSLFSRSINLFGYDPEVGVRYVKRSSSLPFYEYDSVELVFRLSK